MTILKLFLTTLIVIISFVITGCANPYLTAARRVQPQNPHAAIEYIILALQEDSEDDDVLEFLDNSIQAISFEHEKKIKSLTKSKAYEDAVAECDRIIVSANIIGMLPGGNYNLYYKDNQRQNLAKLAAEKNYQIGIISHEEGKTKEAVNSFDKALGFVSNYRDINQRRKNILQEATAFLYIDLEDSNIDNELASLLSNSLETNTRKKRPRFIKFVDNKNEANGICSLNIITDFYDTDWVSKSERKTVSVPQGKRYVHKRGNWTLYTREQKFEITLELDVKSQKDGLPEPSISATEKAEDLSAYARWSGAKAAVPDYIKELPNDPPNPKDKDLLMREAAKKTVEKLSRELFLIYK